MTCKMMKKMVASRFTNKLENNVQYGRLLEKATGYISFYQIRKLI